MLTRSLCLLPLLMFVGCGAAKLNFQNVCSLTPQQPENLNYFEMQSSEQTLTLKVSGTESFSIGIYAKGTVDEPRDLKEAEKISKAIIHKKGIKEETFTVKIPAKTAYSVLVYLGDDTKKPSTVTMNIKN